MEREITFAVLYFYILSLPPPPLATSLSSQKGRIGGGSSRVRTKKGVVGIAWSSSGKAYTCRANGFAPLPEGDLLGLPLERAPVLVPCQTKAH